MAFVNERLNSRTIDYERGAVLKCLGGGMPDTRNREDFELSVRDDIFKFMAFHKISKDEAKNITINWCVKNVNPSSTPQLSQAEIRKIIIEALEEYCMFYDRSKAQVVNVEIND